MSLSKVKSCQGAGDWNNEHGTFYKFEYTFEDGVTISASHKKQEGFAIGAEIEYEIKGKNEHGSYGSVKKPDSGNYNNSNASKGSGGSDSVQTMIVKQNALGHATNIILHNSPGKEVDPVDVIELAGRLAKWVMLPEKKEEGKVEEIAKESKIGEENDDLPF